MCKPKFIIVGCMKAGTTQLVNYLQQSNHIVIDSAERNYFDKIEVPNLKEYVNGFLLPEEREGIVWGEKTAAYSFVPGIPKKIHNILPDIKLIWVFRNPIDRAYSNYWHAVKNGRERESFEDCVANDRVRYKNNIYSAYLTRSLYCDQVSEYLKYFDMSDMYFIISEELRENPQKELNKLCEFLHVPKFNLSTEKSRSNVTSVPRSVWLEYSSRKVFGNSVVYKVLHRLNRKSKFGYPPLDSKTRKALVEFFAESNAHLEDILGKKLDFWNK